VQAPARKHVHRGQILGQAKRVFIAHLHHGRTQPDAQGALAGCSQKGGGRRYATLQVALAHPGTVEAQGLGMGEQLQRVLQPIEGVGVREIARR
jgi:hypothetical protein